MQDCLLSEKGFDMGKAKRRSFHLGIHDRFSNLSREEAVTEAVELLNTDNAEACSLITLFGLSAEELLEAGANYEDVKGIDGLLR